MGENSWNAASSSAIASRRDWTWKVSSVAPRPPGRPLGLRRRPLPLRARELRLHLGELALEQRLLVSERGELPLEHAGALAVLRREPRGDGYGLLVLDLGRETAAPLRVGEPLALERQLAFGVGHRLAGRLH